jgi:hypothetical protein
MAFKVYFSNNLPEQPWSQLTDDWIYTNPEFAEVWRSLKGKPVFLVEEKENSFRAGMAGIMFGKSMFRRFQSMPDGLKGGPVYAEDITASEITQFINDICNWLKSMNVMRADIHFPQNEIDTPFFIRRENETHILHLDRAKIEQREKNLRKHISAAKKRDSEIVIPGDISNIDQYYRLSVLTAERHGSKPRYPKRLLEKLLQLSLTDEHLVWPVVEYKGQPIAFRICFVERNEMFTWQYYSDKNYSQLRPGYLLLDYLINFALEKNIKMFIG